MEIKQKIVDMHGRVDNIRIFDKDAKVVAKEAKEGDKPSFK
eukprot:CAMPEP_0202957324 /NCGR_PEP_ID=MMETSP1396-20130829/1756_1 /ASSEMBLY_ACC=CAM_ASM_000872 /TAXON_ID= /ORGANISM="Pseudokeronopsis sp., Strain Brazil" /LENGTH=40 /DNA_ID= /DNA_START= /DNA_END= /DNA_ORIENTATION=